MPSAQAKFTISNRKSREWKPLLDLFVFLLCRFDLLKTWHFSDYNVAIHIKTNGLEQAKNLPVPGVTLTQTWCLLSGLQNWRETTAPTCSWETVRQKSS
jgi:hypothetical protein